MSGNKDTQKEECENCDLTKDRHYVNTFGKLECDVTYDSKPGVNRKFRLKK
jgi:hypothetical protein